MVHTFATQFRGCLLFCVVTSYIQNSRYNLDHDGFSENKSWNLNLSSQLVIIVLVMIRVLFVMFKLQEGTSIQLWHSGCSWQGSFRWLVPCSTLWCSVLEPSVELVWWRVSWRDRMKRSKEVPTLSAMVTPRVMALALRLLAPLSSSTPSSLPLMPREVPETHMSLYVTSLPYNEIGSNFVWMWFWQFPWLILLMGKWFFCFILLCLF